MLLSLPNWLIHISSSLEWGIASFLMFRYGNMIGRTDVRRLGLFMIPHWIGSWFVLAYHISGDAIPVLLDLSETVNLFGSLALLYASLGILKATKSRNRGGIIAAAGLFLVSGRPQSYMGEDVFDLILQISSVVYLSFLVILVKIKKRDPDSRRFLVCAGVHRRYGILHVPFDRGSRVSDTNSRRSPARKRRKPAYHQQPDDYSGDSPSDKACPNKSLQTARFCSKGLESSGRFQGLPEQQSLF